LSEEFRASEEPENIHATDDQNTDSVDTSVDLEETEPDLEQQLTVAQEQAAEYLDGWQRARAEFANARKRLERGRTEAYRNATVDFARKLLPSIDDFERASDNVPEEIAADSWYEGLQLIQRKLETVLEDLHVERIVAIGQEFDPNFHEALTLKEKEGVESGVVIEELQVGYRIGDLVIRPSLVNVAA
jgi:molecular chaperone GrpE